MAHHIESQEIDVHGRVVAAADRCRRVGVVREAVAEGGHHLEQVFSGCLQHAISRVGIGLRLDSGRDYEDHASLQVSTMIASIELVGDVHVHDHASVSLLSAHARRDPSSIPDLNPEP